MRCEFRVQTSQGLKGAGEGTLRGGDLPERRGGLGGAGRGRRKREEIKKLKLKVCFAITKILLSENYNCGPM